MLNSNIEIMFIDIACFLMHLQQSGENSYVIDVAWAWSGQIMKRTETKTF